MEIYTKFVLDPRIDKPWQDYSKRKATRDPYACGSQLMSLRAINTIPPPGKEAPVEEMPLLDAAARRPHVLGLARRRRLVAAPPLQVDRATHRRATCAARCHHANPRQPALPE